MVQASKIEPLSGFLKKAQRAHRRAETAVDSRVKELWESIAQDALKRANLRHSH
ncbi:MAG: hypothetical protein JOZ72_09350 [Alphaproteobacteria bacterium]|nr:hypothetical protein [Alphaproteobacteria bacterium]